MALSFCLVRLRVILQTVPAKTLSPKEKEFALKEVKILSSLQHKNVVRFIDYFEGN